MVELRAVHVVFHTITTELADEERLIGAFVAVSDAEAAIASLRTKNGFSGSPDGFGVDRHDLGQDQWRGGFEWDGLPESSRELVSDDVDYLPVDDASNLFMVEHRRIYGMHVSRCLIGFYSSREQAVEAAIRLSRQPGFRAFPNGFVVYGLSLGRIHWPEGFDAREARHLHLLGFSVSSLPPS